MEPGTANGTLARADLTTWIAAQKRCSTAAIERAISVTHLTHRRDAFHQTIAPARGSVVASTSIGDWNPDPDYFFHWLRDSAIVMRCVADLIQAATGTEERGRWHSHFHDFVRFSLALTKLDGADLAARSHEDRLATRPEFRKFLRGARELATLHGDKLLGEPRFNPDGTIDIMRWARPQYDGVALRALTCLKFLEDGGAPTPEIAEMLNIDLDFTSRYAGKRCVGPWEEGKGHHYYVALVQLGALAHGRRFAGAAASRWLKAETKLRARLEQHWSKEHEIFVACLPPTPSPAAGQLDAALLLAVLDADLPDGPHSANDPRVHKTQSAIEDLFARTLPINRSRFAGRAPALGRYRDDTYFGGGAWYPTTLAAASLYYRRACSAPAQRAALIARGDAFMSTVRDLTPASGDLSEQVDRETGRQTSAHNLAWSHAAFVSAAHLRSEALGALGRERR